MKKENSLSDYYVLSNNKNIPCMAFGTGVIKRFYRNKKLYFKDIALALLKSIKHRKFVRFFKNDHVVKQVLNIAITLGYKMFDSGRLYGHSEKYIGEVTSKYNRNDFFLITKISDVDLKRYPNVSTVHENLTLSLNFLQTDYVDAYLLHFPSGDWISMYKEIEKEYKAGRARAIGVCNFDVDELKQLMSECSIKPMICQVELNPLNTKKDLQIFCRDNGITLMAHSPTAHMDKRVIDSNIMKELIVKYNKSAAQIIYRWHYQNSIIPIVSSISEKHLKDNLDIYDFSLNEEEMKRIDDLNLNYSFDKNNNKTNDCPEFIYNL